MRCRFGQTIALAVTSVCDPRPAKNTRPGRPGICHRGRRHRLAAADPKRRALYRGIRHFFPKMSTNIHAPAEQKVTPAAGGRGLASGGPSPNFCRCYVLTPPMRSSLSLRGGSAAFKAPCSQPFPAFGQCPSVKCSALSGALRDLDRFRALPSGAGATRNAVIFSFPLSANPRSRGFPSKLA